MAVVKAIRVVEKARLVVVRRVGGQEFVLILLTRRIARVKIASIVMTGMRLMLLLTARKFQTIIAMRGFVG